MSDAAILGGPWTSHGHDIPGVTVAGKGRPGVYRCGGPRICRVCRREAAEHGLREVRPHLDHAGYLTRLTAMLRGEPVPFYRDRELHTGGVMSGLDDLLADLALAHRNEVAQWRDRAESAESSGRYDAVSVARVRRLLRDAYRRKTLRTDDVRAAIEGDRP